jgi:hypothetical protein
MRRSWTWMRIPTGLGLALALGSFAVPSSAETYSWRTEDGVYAYTDDPKHIPQRYADQVQIVRLNSLKSYERFTAQDSAAASHYANRLSERLDHLRAVNAAPPQYAVPAGGIAAAGPTPGTISVATGGENDPRLELPMGQAGDGPLIVEPVTAKRQGDVRTRRITLVKQGDKIVAVLKGSPHIYNPSTDFLDEDALDEGRE